MGDRKSLEQDTEMKDTGVGPSLNMDRNAEKRVLRKIDRHILPLVMLLYLAAFLDRYPQGPHFPLHEQKVVDVYLGLTLGMQSMSTRVQLWCYNEA